MGYRDREERPPRRSHEGREEAAHKGLAGEMSLPKARALVAEYLRIRKAPDHEFHPWIERHWLAYVNASQMLRRMGLR